MKWLVGLVSLLAVAACAFVGYARYPALAFERAIRAVEQKDVVKLEAVIDWPRVRAGLKADFIAPAFAGNAASGDGFAALGAAIGINLVNAMIDNLVSAQMLIAKTDSNEFVARWRKAAVDGRFLTMTAYGIDVWPPDQPAMRATLILELQGVEWRIVRLLPSQDLIAALRDDFKYDSSTRAKSPAGSDLPYDLSVLSLEELQKKMLGKPAGATARLSQSEVSAFRRRIASCWSIPAGAETASDLKIVFRVWFRRDGSIERGPEVIEGSTSPFSPAFAESGRRAILRCAPYTMLGAEKYDAWKDIEIAFKPSDLVARDAKTGPEQGSGAPYDPGEIGRLLSK